MTKRLFDGFFSFWVTLPLLFLYALACAFATFIENDYGSVSAKALVYSSTWFALLHLLLTMNLIGLLVLSRAWQRKKWASLLFHLSFVFIVVAAGITRYFGFEGTLHIREGDTKSAMESSDSYLVVRALYKDTQYNAEFPLTFAPLGRKNFNYEIPIGNEKLSLRYSHYYKDPKPKSQAMAIEFEASFNDETQTITLQGGNSLRGISTPMALGGGKFLLSWGTKEIPLPFSMKLDRFELKRYPGSMSPSSYASEIILSDPEKGIEIPYRIYMNNTLDYGGYRFFQSSYDQDEKGTILSVNKDPGKIPTYIGYAMLTLGLLLSFFDKNGRFSKLARFVRSQQLPALAFMLALSLGNTTTLRANETQGSSEEAIALRTLNNLKANSKEHANAFGRLLVQDFGGRVKPVDTLAADFVHKLTKKDNFLGLTNSQIFLGMILYPNDWKKVKMIRVSTPRLKEVLGVPAEDSYIAFADAFEGDRYKLANYVEEANRKKPSLRDKFDKDVQSVDERLNVSYFIYTAQALRILPSPDSSSTTWSSPIEAMQAFDPSQADYVRGIFQEYFIQFDRGIEENNWTSAEKALGNLVAYQRQYGGDLLLSSARVEAEIFLNHAQPFARLGNLYLLLGLILFIAVFVQILRNHKNPAWLSKGLYWLIILAVALHTLGLALRWYVADHAPWSNAYESMIYVAWAAGIAGILFFRHSQLALSTASITAGVALFVAHLGFMDPQITNLVPVLKSYWLNIHVSVITASYGFLGLSFLLGIVTLILFTLRSPSKPQLDASILSIVAINEMSMIIGLVTLTVGNFLGGVWANESWGRYWGWDPKETWSLISIVLYTLVLHARFIKSLNRPYILTVLSVIAFYAILMTYFGVNYYLTGLHSYASGDPLPIPVYLYYMVALNLLLLFLSGRKRDLEAPRL